MSVMVISISGVWITAICIVLLFCIAAGLIYFSLKHFMKGPMCNSKASLNGKTVIITGGTSGLGKEAALELSLKGARVIFACRDVMKGHEVAGAIRSQSQGEFQVEKCDLSSLTSVRQFAAKMLETESKVDILINCAGVKETPQWTTQDGFEYQLGVNFVSHFLLTWLLLPVIKRAAPGARIVNVSCGQHRDVKFDPDNLFREPVKYKRKYTYARSKLCINLFSMELAHKLEATASGVNVYIANPGLSRTNLGRYLRQTSGIFMSTFQSLFYWPLLRSPNNAVQTILFCAIDETLDDQTGYYYENCCIGQPSEDAENQENASELWRITEREIGLS